MLPSVITFFHFSKSALTNAAPSSGVVPRGSAPTFANAALSSGLFNAFLIAVLSFVLMSAVTPTGVNTVSQRSTLKPLRPVSYTHLRAHETRHDLVCRLLLEK